MNLPGFDVDSQASKSDRQMESAGADASWIQVKYAVFKGLIDLMGVARNNGIDPGGLGFQVQIAQIVKHVESCTSKFDDDGCRELGRPWGGVHIPAHGKDRCNAAKAGEDFG